jgi:hypothetical protein
MSDELSDFVRLWEEIGCMSFYLDVAIQKCCDESTMLVSDLMGTISLLCASINFHLRPERQPRLSHEVQEFGRYLMFELRERFDGDWNHPLRCAAMAVDVGYRGFAFQKMSVSTHEDPFVRTQFQSIFQAHGTKIFFNTVRFYYSLFPDEFQRELDEGGLLNQSIRQKDYEVSDNYLNHSEFAVELSLWLKLDPRSLQDPDTLGPLTFQTDPISFLSYAGAAFGRIKKLGFIVLSIPFGSVENESL